MRARVAHDQRVSVGRRLGDDVGADDASGAGMITRQRPVAQRGRKPLGDESRDGVRRISRRARGDDAYRPAWISVRGTGAAQANDAPRINAWIRGFPKHRIQPRALGEATRGDRRTPHVRRHADAQSLRIRPRARQSSPSPTRRQCLPTPPRPRDLSMSGRRSRSPAQLAARGWRARFRPGSNTG